MASIADVDAGRSKTNPSSMMPNRSASPEKPLPSVPQADTVQVQTKDIDTPQTPRSAGQAKQSSRPQLPGQSSFLRPKIRVVWRNKVCIVGLPLDDGTAPGSKKRRHLKPDEVAQRLKTWSDKGFNTDGFVLDPTSHGSPSSASQGQSCAIHPNPEDLKVERKSQSYRISIPDRQEWESYVNELKEERLRALGVTFSDDEPSSRKSPAPSLMSRQASSQSSAMLTSPPLQASSLSHVAAGSPYNLPNAPNIASFPRYSVAMPYADKVMPHAGQSPPLHRNLSPLGYMSSHSGSRLGSPSMNEQIVAPFSSISPIPSQVRQPTSSPSNTRDQQAPAKKPMHGQAPIDIHPEEADKGRAPALLHAEIVTPIPRGHRQNPSENLQREVEEAETYLEDLERAKEESEEVDKAATSPNKNQTTVKPDKAVNEPEGLVATRTDSSGPPIGDDSHGQVANTAEPEISLPKHGSKRSSSSRLNINAPEFKFQPRTSLGMGRDINTATRRSELPQARANEAQRVSSRLNVAAPVFTPGSFVAPKADHAPAVFSFGLPQRTTVEGKAEVKSDEKFSFSTKEFGLNPDAPSFTPQNHSVATKQTDGPRNAVTEVQRIFGALDFTQLRTQPKRSKKVPIVKPQEQESPESSESDNLPEDELGRITQSDARPKRLRRGHDGGDNVPQFAIPTDLPHVGLKTSQSHDAKKENMQDHEHHAELVPEMNQSHDAEPRNPASKVNPGGEEPVIMANDHIPKSPPAQKSEIDTAALASTQTPDPAKDSTIDSLGASPSSVLRQAHELEDSVTRKDAIMSGVRYVEPSFHEIDTVMRYLNEDGNSDLGVDRDPSPEDRSGLHDHKPMDSSHALTAPPQIRSAVPTSSPNRLHEPFQYLPPTDTDSIRSETARIVAERARYSPSYRPSRSSPVHRLNSAGSTPPSDWDDLVSSGDESQFKSRTGFFDSRLNDIIGAVVKERLDPIERTLKSIHQSLSHHPIQQSSRNASRRPRSSGTLEVFDSDADDEDEGTDEATQTKHARFKSPGHDGKYEQLKIAINEIVATQRTSASADQLSDVLAALGEMKSSVIANREGISGASGEHNAERAAAILADSAALEKSRLQVTNLESMLKSAESRAEDELKARRYTEDALADNHRLLRQALHEASHQRETAEASERNILEFHEERHQALQRSALLEASHEVLEGNASDLAEKNHALETTIAEYRLSHDQWRTNMDDLRHENKELTRQLRTSESKVQDVQSESKRVRDEVQRLKDSVVSTSRSFASDRTRTLDKEAEHSRRLDLLSARLEAEARTRERLEVEIDRLERQEGEAMKSRVQFDQVQKANNHLDKVVGQLRTEIQELRTGKGKLQQELIAARETGIVEAHRIRSTMEVDLRAAKGERKVIEADLRGVIGRLERQLQESHDSITKSKSRHDAAIAEMTHGRHIAVREAAESRNKALQEHSSLHEQILQDLKAQHTQALATAAEKVRDVEARSDERLDLANAKVVQLQGTIGQLEDKLELAKAAAHAAAQAAQLGKTSDNDASVIETAAIVDAYKIPEKISPQALRESIMVLQEQLQARESHIEELESSLSAVDMQAPGRLKDAEAEISWLRELLGVRIDDIQDIIDTLSQPSYDQEALKDAAIRLKANLQMEQQEKERAMTGGRPFASITSIANLTSSPKTLPLAAAAAWGSWRKAREASGSLSGRSTGLEQTPSKSSVSPQSFFAGLMTPPSTSTRQTPPLGSGRRPRLSSSSSMTERALQKASTQRKSLDSHLQSPQHADDASEPVTPPLMQKASYDLDAAETTVFGDAPGQGFNQRDYEVHADDEPFGPRIGTFA